MLRSTDQGQHPGASSTLRSPYCRRRIAAPRPTASPCLLPSAAALTSTALTGAAARSAVTAPNSAASASISPGGPGRACRGVATKRVPAPPRGARTFRARAVPKRSALARLNDLFLAHKCSKQFSLPLNASACLFLFFFFFLVLLS